MKMHILTPAETYEALALANLRLAQKALNTAEVQLMSARFASALRRKIPAHDTVEMSGRAGVSGGGGANV